MMSVRFKAPKAERCTQVGCNNRRAPGRKSCVKCLELGRWHYQRKKREKTAGLAPFLRDPQLLPKAPPK